MKKFLMTSAAILSLGFGSVALADDTAPLAAGGPAAQGMGLPVVGSTLEIAGVVVAVTVAGLVAIDSDNDSLPPQTTPPSTTISTGGGD